jgi:hypothetical protein
MNRRHLLAGILGLPFVQRPRPDGVHRVRNIVIGWTVVIFGPEFHGSAGYDVLFQHDASRRTWGESVKQAELYTRRWSVETWAVWMIPQLNMSPVTEV